MTASAVDARHGRRASRLFAYGSFAVMAGGWLAFLVVLLGSPQTLDDVWAAVRNLALIPELTVWLLGFPFLVGLAIWQASWEEALRLVAIAVLATGYTFAVRPRRPEL